MKFDSLCKFLLNEADEFEDKQELAQDSAPLAAPEPKPGTPEYIKKMQDLNAEQLPTIDKLVAEPAGDIGEDDPENANPRNAKIKLILKTFPKITPEDAAKIVDADLFEVTMDLAADEAPPAVDELEELPPELPVDKEDLESIYGGMQEREKEEREKEDELFSPTDQE